MPTSPVPFTEDPAFDSSRPPLTHLTSGSSTSSAALSTPATSISTLSWPSPPCEPSLSTPSPFFGGLSAPPPTATTTSSLDASPLAMDTMSEPLASSTPVHTFPTFVLSLLTALESDPASVRHHLDNLAQSHAAPANFLPTPMGKPGETDAIVASLSRIADRLRAAEEPVSGAKSRSVDGFDEADPNGRVEAAAAGCAPPKMSTRRPFVPGDSVEQVRKNCEDQIQALKVLHAEELHRAQLSHDNEVR